ncbi:MAG: hypothetical protein PHE12_03145, partial [Clostridia bacterium]|nr:hypothetical protein [Clostridia bacterium]
MESSIKNIIDDIKEKTGIDITIFDMLGGRVAATKDIHNYIKVPSGSFTDNIYCDKSENVCCFLFNSPYNIFMGMINGSDSTAKNYAFMISAMIENSIMQKEENTDKKEAIKKIISGQASDLMIKRLVKKFPVLGLPCFVLAISCNGKDVDDVLNYLEQLAGDSKDSALLFEENIIAYIRNNEGENDYQSAVDFAEM